MNREKFCAPTSNQIRPHYQTYSNYFVNRVLACCGVLGFAINRWIQMIKNRTIFTGDNLPILRGMDSESVDLIYLDPPFNSNRHYSAPIGSKAAGAEFKDAWTFEDTDAAWWGELAEQHEALYRVIDAGGAAGGKGNKAY